MTRPTTGRATRRGVARALDSGGQGAGATAAAAHPQADTDRADSPAERRRWYRYLLWPVLGCAVTAGGMLVVGVQPWRAVAVAVAAGVALWGVIVSTTVPRPEWPYDIPVEVYRAPSVWEVPGLVGAAESEVSFQTYLRPRLWDLAQELLRRRGIDPASERAATLVGVREYAILSGADIDPRRTTSSVPVLCHVIARLAVQPAPGSDPVVRNPVLVGLAGPPGRRQHVTGHAASKGSRS